MGRSFALDVFLLGLANGILVGAVIVWSTLLRLGVLSLHGRCDPGD